MLENIRNQKALKEDKIRETDWKTEFMCGVKRSHYIWCNPNPISLDCVMFYYIYQYYFDINYTLLVIEYVNFATCPKILKGHSTILLVFLKYGPVIMYVK